MRILIAILLFSSTLYAQINSTNLSISGNLKILIGKETVISGKSVALQLSRVETSIDSSKYSIKSLTIKKEYKTIVNTINYRTITDSLGNFEFNALKEDTYTLYLDQDINSSGIVLPEQVIQLDNKSVGNLNLTGTLNCEMNNDLAILHIKEHKPGLVLIGGIAPVIYESDQKFEKSLLSNI